MLTASGPKLIEYNARFGDPETQVLMLRLESDLLDLLYATATGNLARQDRHLAARSGADHGDGQQGLSGRLKKGTPIGAAARPKRADLKVFHAGTRREGDQLLSNGGRVLNVTALGASVAEAKERADAAIAQIDWPEGFYRHDIGWREILRERNARLDR